MFPRHGYYHINEIKTSSKYEKQQMSYFQKQIRSHKGFVAFKSLPLLKTTVECLRITLM